MVIFGVGGCFGEHFVLILVPFAVPVTIIAEALREIFCSIEDSARSRISYARFSRELLFSGQFLGVPLRHLTWGPIAQS